MAKAKNIEQDASIETETPIFKADEPVKKGPGKGKTDKTPNELREQALDNLDHAVERMVHWMDEVEKKLVSKRHPLTEAQKSAVMDALDEKYGIFQLHVREQTAEEEGFKVPR